MLPATEKSPEIASEAFAATSTSETYYPFFPSMEGTKTLRVGGVLSLCHADNPLTVLPLVEVAT